MRALPRPAFVLGLSIAIAATSLLGASSVALAATKPVVTSLSISSPVFEGDRPTITGTFTDPDATDQHALQIGWGDGSTERFTLPVGDRSFSLQKSIAYPENYTDLVISVELSDGLFFVNKFLTLTVSNAAPSVTSFSLSRAEVDLGQTVTATGGFDDPGTADTHTVTVDWGDNSTPTTLNLARRVWTFTTPEHTYGAAGTFTVTATVADDDGGSDNATAGVVVNGANTPPSVLSFALTAGSEGGSSGLSLTFADADPSDTHTVVVTWGDGNTTTSPDLAPSVTTYDATHVYADTGTYTVGLTLNDSAGHSVTTSASVSPANVGPAMGSLALSPSSVVDGQLLTVSGTFTDPGTADTFTLTVDWGDGSSSEQSLGTARSFSASHTYAAARSVTITATVTDRDNGTSRSSVDLVVGSSNHAPTGLTVDVSASGANVVLDASFSDADADDTHAVTVSWGDGTTSGDSLAAGTTTFTSSHIYGASNTYTVTVSVTDSRGASTNATTSVVVTVPATGASALIDEMSGVVRSFDLDRNTERWLLKKLDDLQGSLAYGNGQVCGAGLTHILSFADRTLTHEHYAALSALASQLQSAAGCTSNGAQPSPKVQKAPAVTTTAAPAPKAQGTEPKKDTTAKGAAKDAAKSTKADSKATPGRSAH